MRVKILICILVLAMILPGCSDPFKKYEKKEENLTAAEQAEKNWTIMLYIAADVEENIAELLADELIDVLKIGSTDNCHIVTQIDLPGKKEKSRRYYILKEKLIVRGKFENSNMGDPETLKGFLNWGLSHKAQKYAFIVMGHGTGWMSLSGPGSIGGALTQPSKSVQIDLDALKNNERSFGYSHTDNDCITLAEFKNILKETLNGKRLDVCAFNSCLMSQVEVAYQMKDYADYMVASETTMPGFGFDYPYLINRISKLNLTPLELSNTILESAESEYRKMKAKIPGLLSEIKKLDNDWEENHYWEIKDLKQQVKTIRALDYQVGVSDIQKVRELRNSVKRFVEAWKPYQQANPQEAKAIAAAAREKSKKFGDMFKEVYKQIGETPKDNNEYIDLDEFMLEVYDRTNYEPVSYAAQDVIENLYKFVVNTFNSNNTIKYTRSSVYFPPSVKLYTGLTRDFYKQIDWSTESQWIEFLDKMAE